MLVVIVALLLVIVQTVCIHPILIPGIFAMVLMIVLQKVRHGVTRKQVAKALCGHLHGIPI